MNNLVLGLTTMAIGLVVVFIGLIILIGMIYIMTLITGRKKQRLKEIVPAASYAAVGVPAAEKAKEETRNDDSVDDAVIAAVTAAIACVWDGEESGFVVRRIRRVSAPSAWRNA